MAFSQTADWDAIIVENVKRIRAEQSLDMADIAGGLHAATGEAWDDNRVYRVLGGYNGRHFKWAEVVALAHALRTTIFELVLPADHKSATFNQLSREFGMFPRDLIATERDATRRQTRRHHNTRWALQYHPLVKAIWEHGKAEAQEIVERGELGADAVLEKTRVSAAAETTRIYRTAYGKDLWSETLEKMSDQEVDQGGAPGYHTEETALAILEELGFLDDTKGT